MNFAKLQNSDRLQRVYRLLSDGNWYSTLDIIRRAHVCAVSAIISELRYNGYDIDCVRSGKDRYVYRLNR